MIPIIGYKIIYKNIIYNCINLTFWNENDLEVAYIDENGRIQIVKGNREEFQFISK